MCNRKIRCCQLHPNTELISISNEFELRLPCMPHSLSGCHVDTWLLHLCHFIDEVDVHLVTVLVSSDVTSSTSQRTDGERHACLLAEQRPLCMKRSLHRDLLSSSTNYRHFVCTWPDGYINTGQFATGIACTFKFTEPWFRLTSVPIGLLSASHLQSQIRQFLLTRSYLYQIWPLSRGTEHSLQPTYNYSPLPINNWLLRANNTTKNTGFTVNGRCRW